MLVKLSRQDIHSSEVMGADTVKLCEMQGFSPRLENDRQSRVEANIYGFKAEFAVARLLGADLPTVNVVSDGGVDAWVDDISIDVKFNNAEFGKLIFDNMDKFKAQVAVLVGKTADPAVMRVNGWVGRKTFMEKSVSHNFGYGDRLVMNDSDLYSIETLWRKLAEKRFS
tara:strand:- start:850 stop:1356 length:507 start_codon:yes stop_codon:yes gene_type:complete